MADIIAEAHSGAQDDTDRVLFGWDFLRHLHYHSYPLFGENELHDPVKYFNMCVFRPLVERSLKLPLFVVAAVRRCHL